MKQWACDQTYMNDGKTIATVRPAKSGETDSKRSTRKATYYTDIFPNKEQAVKFRNQTQVA